MISKEELGTQADALNAQLREVEDLFADRFSVPASVEVSPAVKLRFGKRGKFWTLEMEVAYEYLPLNLSSLEHRVLAAEHLGELFDILVEKQNDTARRMGAVCEELSKLREEIASVIPR